MLSQQILPKGWKKHLMKYDLKIFWVHCDNLKCSKNYFKYVQRGIHQKNTTIQFHSLVAFCKSKSFWEVLTQNRSHSLFPVTNCEPSFNTIQTRPDQNFLSTRLLNQSLGTKSFQIQTKKWYIFCFQNCSDLLWGKKILLI